MAGGMMHLVRYGAHYNFGQGLFWEVASSRSGRPMWPGWCNANGENAAQVTALMLRMN